MMKLAMGQKKKAKNLPMGLPQNLSLPTLLPQIRKMHSTFQPGQAVIADEETTDIILWGCERKPPKPVKHKAGGHQSKSGTSTHRQDKPFIKEKK